VDLVQGIQLKSQALSAGVPGQASSPLLSLPYLFTVANKTRRRKQMSALLRGHVAGSDNASAPACSDRATGDPEPPSSLCSVAKSPEREAGRAPTFHL
jgi:hypothetical protein